MGVREQRRLGMRSKKSAMSRIAPGVIVLAAPMWSNPCSRPDVEYNEMGLDRSNEAADTSGSKAPNTSRSSAAGGPNEGEASRPLGARPRAKAAIAAPLAEEQKPQQLLDIACLNTKPPKSEKTHLDALVAARDWVNLRECLLNRGMEVDATKQSSFLLHHLAQPSRLVASGNNRGNVTRDEITKIVRVLVNAGINPHQPNRRGSTALGLAKNYKDDDATSDDVYHGLKTVLNEKRRSAARSAGKCKNCSNCEDCKTADKW